MNGKWNLTRLGVTLSALALVFAVALGSALANCGTCDAQGGCSGAKCSAHEEGAACACKAAAATKTTEELSPLVAAAKAKVEAAGVGFLTAQHLSAKLKSDKPLVVVDVLSAKSFAASHIKGAINIPLSDIAKSAPALLKDKKAEIVVYCGSYQCGASLQAAASLKALGYTNIHDYKGGLKEWTELGLPLVKPAAEE